MKSIMKPDSQPTQVVAIFSALTLLWLLAAPVYSRQPNNQETKGQIPNQQDETPQETMDKRIKDVHKLRPPFPTEELLTKSQKSIQDGLDYLVDSQNEDGSWGSHDPKLASWADLAFSVRKHGSHDAVRTACTAICAQALMNQVPRTDKQQAALKKAIAELVKIRKFAYEPGTSFNTWGYGYKLDFLVQLNKNKEGENLKKEILAAAQSCVDGLLRYQQHTGGWSYYAGPSRGADNMSFNTGLFALSLSRAAKMGCNVPKGMVKDSSKAVDRMRAPDGSFAYDSRFETEKSSHAVLGNLGAGSRTMSATVAMYELGVYHREHLRQAMVIFDKSENYLETGRKLLQPHAAPQQISGYFFFFGYNYATEAAVILGDEVNQARWDRFCWTMLRTQEADGRWWDTAWASYGEKWGTGFAVQTLQRYIAVTSNRSGKTGAENQILDKAKSAIEKAQGTSTDRD